MRLSLTDQAIAFGAGSLSEAGVRRCSALWIAAMPCAWSRRWRPGRRRGHCCSRRLSSLGLSATGTLEEMVALLQQMAVLQAVPDALDESDPDAPTAQRLAGLLAPDETQFLYSIVLHGRAELGLAPDEYSGLVMVLLRMLAFRPSGVAAAPQRSSMPTASAKPAPAAPMLSKPVAASSGPAVPARPAVVASAPVARASAPASEPPPWLDDEPPYEGEVLAAAVSVREPEPQAIQRPPAPVAVAAATWEPTPLGDRWAEVVSQMNQAASISALVRELAMQAQCVAIDEQAQTVRVAAACGARDSAHTRRNATSYRPRCPSS
jgi:DNA polymerase-3 subunit gamma/tau